MLASILATYGIKSHEWMIQPFGTGLINDTWLIKKDDEEYIVQRINHNVFKELYAIFNNIRLIGNYLQQIFPRLLLCDADTINNKTGYSTKQLKLLQGSSIR